MASAPQADVRSAVWEALRAGDPHRADELARSRLETEDDPELRLGLDRQELNFEPRGIARLVAEQAGHGLEGVTGDQGNAPPCRICVADDCADCVSGRTQNIYFWACGPRQRLTLSP